MKTEYVFNKSISINPIDRKSIYIQINYDQNSIINQAYPQVGIKNLRFAREDVSLFQEYAKANGLFYAAYFDINMSKANNRPYTVPLYLDQTDGYKYSRDGVEASIKLYMSLDWLNDIIDSFTFESIVTTVESGDNVTPQLTAAYNYIQSHTFYVPYVISTIPNYLQAFQGLLTVISMFMMLEKEAVDLSTVTFNLAGFFTTAPAVLGFIAHIVYIALQAAALYATFSHFIYSVIQPVKYHATMMMSDLLTTACLAMGLEFESSIFQTDPFNRIAFLPEKYIPAALGDSGQNLSLVGTLIKNDFSVTNLVGGYTVPDEDNQQGYPIMTGGDLFRIAKSLCNGKVLLQNPDTNPNVSEPTLVFERRDFVPNTPQYQLPDVRADWQGYNTSEFNATTTISFAKDLNDKNTFDQYQGEKLSSVVQCINQPDVLLAVTKGLREIKIDAARGIRKEKLTIPEQIIVDIFTILNPVGAAIQFALDEAAKALNLIIGIWNDIIDVLHDLGIIDNATKNSLHIQSANTNQPNPFKELVQDFESRIGYLQMEADLVNIPKVLLMDVEKATYIKSKQGNQVKVIPLDKMNSSIVNTLFLWNQFYLIDSWVPVGGYAVPTYTDTQGNGCSTPGYNYGTFSRPPGGDKGRHNQYALIAPANNKSSDTNKVSLDYQEFNLLANNNTFTDMDGDAVIADSVDWHFEEGWMDLTYRKSELYDTNLSNLITLPTGQ